MSSSLPTSYVYWNSQLEDTRGRESRRLHGADTQADQWESPSCTQEVHQCYRYEDSTLKILQNQIISITVWCSMLKTVNMCFLLDMLTPDELNTIERLTGCTAQIRPPSCRTTPLINKYRTITSICNNRSVFPSFGVFFKDSVFAELTPKFTIPRRNPLLGASNTAFTRWLPAQYEDGISQPKGWDPNKLHNGATLPLVWLGIVYLTINEAPNQLTMSEYFPFNFRSDWFQIVF